MILAVCALMLITDPSVRSAIFSVLTLSAAVAVAIGTRINRPERPLIWYLIALALLMNAIAEALWYFYDFVLETQPFPSLADAFYLGAYPLLAAGLMILIGERERRPDKAALVDAAILAIATGLLAWVLVISPHSED
ncbi:MAG: hypothetical protein L0G70_10565, partial [Rubrobacter sp.]|nr:hypothetical protein [Rubrobacter sp.]